MLRNYIKIAWRSLLRDRVFSTINILGLATGLAVTMSIIQYIRYELSYEDTHEYADRIVRLTMDYFDGDVVTFQDAGMYGQVALRIKADIPEVEDVTSVTTASFITFSIGEKPFKESGILLANPSFFRVFSYPFLEGNKEKALSNPFEVVLTQSLAKKYFGNQPALNKTLKYSWEERDYYFSVVGVIPDNPENTHLKFKMLISWPTTQIIWKWLNHNWDNNNEYTYVLLEELASYNGFTEKLIHFNEILETEKRFPGERIVSQPLKDIHLYSKKGYELEAPGDAKGVYFLLVIALFVILIAWVNYVNLSTAKSLERAKEVGIRKVVGSNKSQLKLQFLTEAALSNAIACVLAVSLIQSFSPIIRNISGLPENYTFIYDPYFWMTLGILLLLSILLSGFYPAIVLSSFQPSMVLKGKFSNSLKGQNLRRILVILQFSLTIILLTGTLTVSEQVNYMKTKDLGMSLNNKLIIESPTVGREKQNANIFQNQLLNLEINNISFSLAVPGSEDRLGSTNSVSLIGASQAQNYNFYIYAIDDGFTDLFDIKMLAGENFNQEKNNDGKIIVNEESLRLWEIPNPEDAIGRKVDFWGIERTIIGVVKDFHQTSVKVPLLPLIFRYSSVSRGFWNYVSIDVSSKASDQLSQIKEAYKSAFPNSIFSYFFLDERYNIQYSSDENFYRVVKIITILAIFIATLGLLGLVSFTTTQRTKEIGIRKVLGASVGQILTLLSTVFLKLVLLAIVLATPLAYITANKWLTGFPYRIEISWWIIAIPVVLILSVTLISISLESIKAARRNPVEALRYE